MDLPYPASMKQLDITYDITWKYMKHLMDIPLAISCYIQLYQAGDLGISAPGSWGPALWWQLVSRGKKGKWWDGATPNFWPFLNFRLEFGGTKFRDPNWTVQTHLKTLTLVFELPLWLSDLGQNVGSAEFGSSLLVEAGSTTTWFCTVLLGKSPHFCCEDAFFLIAHIDIKSELFFLSLNRLV